MDLRKNRCKEQLEDLENRTMSTQEQLSDTERACKQKFDELSVICSQVQMLEYKIEQFKNGQSYQAIEQITRDRVNELLADNKKLLEYALVSIIDALRNDPDRYLLIDKIPYDSLGIVESTLYQEDYQFVKEKVLVIADKTFHKLTRDLAENFIYSRRIGKGNFIFCGNGRIRNRRCRFVRNQTHTIRFG